jgi:hypothetical protein
MKKLLLCLSLLSTTYVGLAQLVDIELETFVVHPETDYSDGVNLDGYTTYRLWAVLQNEDDFVSSVFGVEDVITQVNTTTDFWQSDFGGLSSENISESALAFVPSLEYDSYITIGKIFQSDPGTATFTAGTDWINQFEPGGAPGSSFTIQGDVGGAWFTVNLGAEESINAYAGDDLKVLIGQFTTTGAITGCVNVQVFVNGVGENDVNTEICFGASFGCTDPLANNYDSSVEEDDGSCLYDCSLVQDDVSVVMPSCDGDSNGSIMVTVTGEQQFSDFQLDDGAIVAVGSFTGLAAGDYTVTVTDAVCTDGDALVIDVTVGSPDPIVFDVAIQTDISCSGDTDGWIAGTASGGTGILNFDLDDTFANAGTSINYTDLGSGDYTIWAMDEAGCIVSTEVFSLNNPFPLSVSVSNSADATCFDSADGIIVMSSSGGTGEVGYSLDNVDFQTTNVINDAPVGDLTVYAMDANGCVSQVDHTVGGPEEMIVGGNISTPSCFDDCDGAIQATISGGNGQWDFWLNDGELTGLGEFTDLCAGDYWIYAEDWEGCLDSALLTVGQPEMLVGTANSTDISCFGESDGSIDVEVAGGTAEYDFAIDCANFAAISVFDDLEAGSYTICIVDSNGCTAEAEGTVVEPDALSIDGITATNETTAGGDGSIAMDFSGGTGPYTFSWVDSSGTEVSTDEDPADLGVGCYTVTITDDNGCEISSDTPSCVDVSVTSLENGVEFSVYPNPTNGIINMNINGLDNSKVAYTLTDATGRVVMGEELNVLSGDYNYVVDLGSASNGVYFLNVTIGQSQRTVKVVKQF